MNFSILKKKRFKFQVDLMVADLTHVPFVNAVLFAKVRLEGGNFCETSQRVEVINHHAFWGKAFNFSCRIAANQQTGILEPCICRISIRKELKGGKSYQKLGFVDVNLSEFAGSGVDGLTKSYLLEGYNGGCQRQDNSLLRINASMVLQSADPCFKVPPSINGQVSRVQGAASDSAVAAAPQARRGDDRLSMNSQSSSGFESLGRRTKPAAAAAAAASAVVPNLATQTTSEESTPTEFAPSHSRNSSQTSHHSHGSGGYGSACLTHSRQSSSESGNARRHSSELAIGSGGGATAASSAANLTNPAFGPSVNRLAAAAPPPLKKRIPSATDICASGSGQRRIDSTRVDAGEVIAELLEGYGCSPDTSAKMDDSSGLQLLISKEDGSATVVGSRDTVRSRVKEGLFEQVIIDDDDIQRR